MRILTRAVDFYLFFFLQYTSVHNFQEATSDVVWSSPIRVSWRRGYKLAISSLFENVQYICHCICVFYLLLRHLKRLFSSILKNLLGFLDTGDKCFQFPPFSARFIVAIFRINCGIHQLANLDKSEKDKDLANKHFHFSFCVVCCLIT